MAKINPKDRSNGTGDGGAVLPAGEYGIAIVWAARKTSKKGTEFFRVKVEVTDGRHKGKTTYLIFSNDLSKQGAVNRWRIIAESVGQEDEFDLGSHAEGNAEEGDATFKRIFFGQPFRVRLKATQSGEYTNNDIENFVFPRMWSPEQRAAMDAWRAAWLAKRDDLGPPDEDGAQPQAGEVDDWGTAPSFDDDIPF
jgi:hypothetical protein